MVREITWKSFSARISRHLRKFQSSRIVVAEGLDEGGELLFVGGEGGEEKVAVCLEDAAPEGGIGGGDAGHVAVAAAGELEGQFALQVGFDCVAQGEGEHVGQMAYQGDKAIVGGGIQQERAGVEGCDFGPRNSRV